MTLLKIIGLVLCVILLFGAVRGFIANLRSPRHVKEAHRRLRRIVRVMKRRSLTHEELEILKDAERVGMVQTSMCRRKGVFYLRYYVSQFGHEMMFEGKYPTADQIDEELKQFEVPAARA